MYSTLWLQDQFVTISPPKSHGLTTVHSTSKSSVTAPRWRFSYYRCDSGIQTFHSLYYTNDTFTKRRRHPQPNPWASQQRNLNQPDHPSGREEGNYPPSWAPGPTHETQYRWSPWPTTTPFQHGSTARSKHSR